jgi:hypothetical protein
MMLTSNELGGSWFAYGSTRALAMRRTESKMRSAVESAEHRLDGNRRDNGEGNLDS